MKKNLASITNNLSTKIIYLQLATIQQYNEFIIHKYKIKIHTMLQKFVLKIVTIAIENDTIFLDNG